MKLIPAEVASWDGVTMRIHIPGYTDGAEMGMRAEVVFPIADRPSYTGYKILAGDPIWVFFNGEDPNSPMVFGFRNKNTGENRDNRRFEHTHFEAHAAENMKMTSQNHQIESDFFQVKSGQIILKGRVKIDGPLETTSVISAKGNISSSGDIKAGAISLKAHTHTAQGDKAKTTVAQ